MIDELTGFIKIVWPRLFVCLFFGIGMSFIPWMFEMQWWVKLLMGIGIFGCWLILGVVLEIIHAVRKKSAEKQANAPLNSR